MAKISPQDLSVAVGQYLENELAPKSAGLQKVALYLAIPVITAKAPELIEQFRPALGYLDALTEDGMIELDALHPRLKDAVHKAGKVPVMGIIFDESDVDKLYAIAQPLAQ